MPPKPKELLRTYLSGWERPLSRTRSKPGVISSHGSWQLSVGGMWLFSMARQQMAASMAPGRAERMAVVGLGAADGGGLLAEEFA